MPKGSYLSNTGRVEAFSCAPGPAGWRFLSDHLDLACDAGFRPVRFRVDDTVVGRGSRLDDGMPVLIWARPGEDERVSPADVVLSGSAGAWLAAARHVASPGEGQLSRVVAALAISPGGGVVIEKHRFSRVAAQWHSAEPDSGLGGLLVETWHADDLGVGVRRVLHLAGDVLLYGESVPEPGCSVEVNTLESPPSQLLPNRSE